MQMKSVCVQWHTIFIARKLQGKGFFHCSQLCIAPLWRLLVLTFQGKGRQVSCTHWHLWLSHNAEWWWTKCTAGFYSASSFYLCSSLCALSLSNCGSTVSSMESRKAFHPVSPANAGLCDCADWVFVLMSVLSVLLFHILPPLPSQSTIKCPTFHSFQVYTSATLKFCLLFFFSWLTTVHKAGLHKTPLDILGYWPWHESNPFQALCFGKLSMQDYSHHKSVVIEAMLSTEKHYFIQQWLNKPVLLPQI